MKLLIGLIIFVWSLQGYSLNSAVRQPDLGFEYYWSKAKVEFEVQQKSNVGINVGEAKSVMDKAIPVAEFKNEMVALTKSADSEVNELFQFLRDKRDFVDDADFKRRITWLYPDDGCYARSALMQSMLNNKIKESWNQVFVFGNLDLKTEFHPNGFVTWWYHVAPIVRTPSGVFVFDPGVNPEAPTPFLEWLKKINAGNDATVAICSSQAYVPGSYCHNEVVDHSAEAQQEARRVFFANEWNRLEDLGLLPQEMLGDNPPWKKTLAH